MSQEDAHWGLEGLDEKSGRTQLPTRDPGGCPHILWALGPATYMLMSIVANELNSHVWCKIPAVAG